MLKNVLAALLGCAITAGPAFAAQPILRISALATGEILLEQKPTTIAALDEALAELKRKGGVVWYYREGAGGEPSPQALQVIQLVVKHKLPISMSTRADFLDYVDADGVAHARETTGN